MTPLHYACRNGFLELADLLLVHGANIDPTTKVIVSLFSGSLCRFRRIKPRYIWLARVDTHVSCHFSWSEEQIQIY
jgi:hypothetical protein